MYELPESVHKRIPRIKKDNDIVISVGIILYTLLKFSMSAVSDCKKSQILKIKLILEETATKQRKNFFRFLFCLLRLKRNYGKPFFVLAQRK